MPPSLARRPRLVGLYALVEHGRGDTFRPDRRITDLIEVGRRPPRLSPASPVPTTAPTINLLEQQVRRALQQPPRKAADLAARHIPACDGCRRPPPLFLTALKEAYCS